MALGNLFSKFSIRKQILLGFAPVVLILIALAVVSNSNFNNFLIKTERLKQATDETTLILEIDKDMVELQRSVLVYSYIGYSGVIRKIRFLEKTIEERFAILDVSLNDDDKQIKERFSRLKNHYQGYKEGFEETILKRKKLTNIMEKEALPIHEKLQTMIKDLMTASAKQKNFEAALLAAEIRRELLQMRINFNSFMSTPDARTIDDTKIIVKEILKNTKILERTVSDKRSLNIVKKVGILAGDYEKKFLDMVNINRGYLALINVVLAGKAAEIDKLTKEIDELEKEELRSINEQIKQNMQEAQTQYRLLSVFAALIGIMSALLIARGIAKPVQNITKTLTHLARGEKEIDIPGLNRADEVGKMAIAANEFKEMAHHLEEQTKELKIANKEANKAKDIAQKANHAKSEFLATMSHEIRTPMNGIFGMAELIMDSKISIKQKGYLQTLMGSAESLLVIIDDILDFSKIEAGKLELEPIPINLTYLVKETAKAFTIEAQNKGLEIKIQYGKDVPNLVIADPVRVRQIIINLIGNALKFTEKGHIFINVENNLSQKTPKGKATIKISVEDTGVGIPKKYQKKLFEKFTQADSSTTRKFGGTGLGLAICMQLAKLMGGKAGLKSVEGKGSTFWFTMLLDLASENIDTLPKVKDQRGANISFKGTRILIAEDNRVNQEFLKEILNSLGCNTIIAANGKEAVNFALNEEFDLIFMDCQMPVMDGFEASKQLALAKANNKIKEVPIIAVTANAVKGDRQKCIDSGMQDYVSKPVRKAIIVYMLKTWLPLKIADDSSEANHNYKDLKILVVEDNRINLEFILEILRGLECDVDSALNGQIALDKVKESEFNLIFMDCQMPIMDGYEATAKIKKMITNKQIKPVSIVALTANALAGDRQKCIDAGMDDYFTKPARKASILQMIDKWAFTSYAQPKKK